METLKKYLVESFVLGLIVAFCVSVFSIKSAGNGAYAGVLSVSAERAPAIGR